MRVPKPLQLLLQRGAKTRSEAVGRTGLWARTQEARLRELDQVFQEGDARYRRREVPDYLMNNITFEMLRDPVIAPSGITYDAARRSPGRRCHGR